MFDIRIVLIALLLCPLGAIHAQEPVSPEHAAKMAKGLDLFKKSVRPILTGRCLKCHGGESVESELDGDLTIVTINYPLADNQTYPVS